MKTKLEMAHEYALEMLKETIPTGSLYGSEARSVAESIVKSAFALADMMQAEADKRLSRPQHLKKRLIMNTWRKITMQSNMRSFITPEKVGMTIQATSKTHYGSVQNESE